MKTTCYSFTPHVHLVRAVTSSYRTADNYWNTKRLNLLLEIVWRLLAYTDLTNVRRREYKKYCYLEREREREIKQHF